MKPKKQGNGLFISFEGGEGAGKSTQIKLLAHYLKKQGYQVKSIREPGGSRISEAIRTITHNPAYAELSRQAEALLFAAARAQLVDEVYQPLIKKGCIVLADRYVDSSYVYQGYGRQLGFKAIKAINDFATGRLLPDLTFWLKIDRQTGHARRRSTAKIDRMDLQKEDFYQAVDRGYVAIARKYSKRIVAIDADQAPIQVHRQIIKRLDQML